MVLHVLNESYIRLEWTLMAHHGDVSIQRKTCNTRPACMSTARNNIISKETATTNE